ncbi:MAG TPA: AraC family transcriptional regulator [Clostridia bacterium]|nr:AraC family transcriptional regulator [Clostridia bacterium]
MRKANTDGDVAVERIREFIHAHLQDEITASDVAKAAGYSQYHAARLFKSEMDLSPFEYIRRERLVQSAHVLRSSKPKVLDIALDFVFDSHEGFTRAFSNAFGITPKKYANHPTPNGWLIPYRYLDRQKSKSEGFVMQEQTAIIFTQIIERPARKLILRRSKEAAEYYAYCEEFGCGTPEMPSPWEILCGIKEALYEPVGVWLPDNMRPAGSGIYAHGVEVPADYTGKVPEQFDIIDLAPCKLLVFQGEPYDDAHYQEAVDLCIERIGKFNPEVYGYQYADELAPKMQLAPMGWRGYIEMRPIRSMK